MLECWSRGRGRISIQYIYLCLQTECGVQSAVLRIRKSHGCLSGVCLGAGAARGRAGLAGGLERAVCSLIDLSLLY